MADSRAKLILDALLTRCQAITIDGGYETNAGRQVVVNQQAIEPHLLDAGPVIVITEGDAEPNSTPSLPRVKWQWPIVIEALALPRGAQVPHAVAHQLLADLQKAVLQHDARDLGHKATELEVDSIGTQPPEDGGGVVGAHLALTVHYTTGYGDPYN